jgi:hypothetical protein
MPTKEAGWQGRLQRLWARLGGLGSLGSRSRRRVPPFPAPGGAGSPAGAGWDASADARAQQAGRLAAAGARLHAEDDRLQAERAYGVIDLGSTSGPRSATPGTTRPTAPRSGGSGPAGSVRLRDLTRHWWRGSEPPTGEPQGQPARRSSAAGGPGAACLPEPASAALTQAPAAARLGVGLEAVRAAVRRRRDASAA